MSKAIKYYLLAYNAIAFFAWLAWGLAFATCQHTPLWLLNIAQGLAVLEIAHVVFGWVKSPVGSTVAQVASRLLVLVLIDYFFPDLILHHYVMWGLIVVSIAWTITELIRYSFYFFALLGRQPRFLLWARYTFFIVLYPIGVTGEWIVILTPVITYGFIPATGVGDRPINSIPYMIFAAIVAVSYIYYFPVLYKYMWKQRKAKL